MSDTPGRVLSSLATSSSEKRNSKLGGCAGVFFQLFDWNRRLNGKRLLPHKLLPAERPAKYASRNHKDEKLPMAKLLLIADENRGGFPRALPNDSGEAFSKEKTPEKKKNKRGPSVVAKLMGLETMPSPEPFKDRSQVKGNSFHKIDENILSCDPEVPSFRAKSSAANPSHGPTLQNAPTLRDNIHSKPPRALVCHKSDDPKVSFFYKLPALSPRKAETAFRSILSPSKSHNKLLSPIKSPLTAKRAARLLEAAAKILEPSMQPSIRARGLGINSQAAARSLLGSNVDREDHKSGSMTSRPSPMCPKKKPALASDSKKQQKGSAMRIYADQPKAEGKSKQDKKPVNAQDSNAGCKLQAPISNRRSSSVPSNQDNLRRSGSTKEENVCHVSSSAGQQRLIRSKSVKDELEQGKGKPESRRQQQNCSRLRQPCTGVKKRGSNFSPSDENFIDVENQNPNIVAVTPNFGDARKSFSADSLATSSSSSGILNYGRLFSSRKAVTNQEPSKKAQKKGDSSVMKSFLRKKTVATDSSGKSGLKAVPKDSSQLSKIGKVDDLEKPSSSDSQIDSNSVPLSLDCIIEESFDDNGDPSSCNIASSAFSPSLSITRAVTETSDISDETTMKSITRDIAKREPCDNNQVASSLSTCTTLVDSGAGALELSIQSSCDSSAGDFGDSASSSYAHLELSSHRRKKPVSYSGKSTAAILQELLMALNSAKTQVALDESAQDVSDSSECVSSSKFTLCTRVGEECEDSASSASAMNHDLRTTPMATKTFVPRGECNDDWRHPSPVSTLDFPFEDDSSALSDNFEDAQERTLLSKVRPKNHHDFVSRRHYIDLPGTRVESKAHKEAFECEEQYVEDIVKTAKISPVDIYAAKLQLPCALLDPVVFTNLEKQFYQQWEWGVRPEDNMYAKCRSETDMRYTRSLYVEAGVQNRKLVFECVNEALNMQLGINEHHSRQSCSQSLQSLCVGHVSQSVCRQMEAWRGMACCMNIDDLVDQEMNTGFGKWVDFSDEVSDFAVEMEGNIVRGLIDELVNELGRRLPNKQGNRRERIRAW